MQTKLDKAFKIIVDISNRKVTIPQAISWYVTDENIAHLNYQIIDEVEDSIIDIQSYKLSMRVLTPSRILKEVNYTLSDATNNIFTLTLPDELITEKGRHQCELSIEYLGDKLTSEPFNYNIIQSIANQLDSTISKDSHYPLVLELEDKLKEWNNILDEQVSKVIILDNDVRNAERTRQANENNRIQAEQLREQEFDGMRAEMTAHKNEVSEELEGKANKEDLYLNVRDFGAKGDGVTDDREAIQNALDYIAERGGGCLYFPHPDNYYRIGSTVIEDEKNVGLIIKSHGVRMMGEHMSVKIQARAGMDTLIYFPSRADRFTLEDITISGNYVVDYCMYTNEYCPYMKLDNVRFEQANNTALYVYTYVTVLNKCIFASSPLGVDLRGLSDNIATSTTFISCYAISCTVGYRTTHATYCSFVSCACDHADIGYDIIGRGIGMTGCGCEVSKQPLKFSSFRGISINGFYAFNCGGEDEDNKVDYLVEFVTGAHATISGMMFENCKNFNYKLGLTTNGYGYENITITDDCISKNECYFVTNWKFATNPIKLLRNETTKAVTITCTIDQLRAEFDKLPDVINHDVTITISGGTTSSYITLQNKTGRGRIILDLNGQDIAPTNESVYAIRINNVNVNMLIHNGTLSQTKAHNYAEIASVYNSGCIAFKNVAFNNITGNKGGAAVCCMRNAVVSVYNCTYSGWFEADNIYKVYHNDGSCITQGEITQQS